MFNSAVTFGADVDDDDDGDPAVAVVAAERQIVISEQQFDQMIFGGGRQVAVQVNGVQQIQVIEQQTAADFRKRLETQLTVEITLANQECNLSESQQKKLRLAGRGDILQFLDRVLDLRRRCTKGPLTQQEWSAFSLELQPLRVARAPVMFGESSLFRKTLHRTLTGDQQVRYRVLERQQHVNMIENVLTNWDRLPTAVRLTGETRKKFIDLLVDRG